MAVAESMTGYLSSAQVGRRLGVSSARVRALRREGRLEGIRTSLGHLHPSSAVEALERHRATRQSKDAVAAPAVPPRETAAPRADAPTVGVTFDDLLRVIARSSQGGNQ